MSTVHRSTESPEEPQHQQQKKNRLKPQLLIRKQTMLQNCLWCLVMMMVIKMGAIKRDPEREITWPCNAKHKVLRFYLLVHQKSFDLETINSGMLARSVLNLDHWTPCWVVTRSWSAWWGCDESWMASVDRCSLRKWAVVWYIVAADWIVGREWFFCRVPAIISSCCGTGSVKVDYWV